MAIDQPTHCRNGHQFGPFRVIVGFRHCECDGAIGGGHRTYRCRIEGCNDQIIWQCVDQSQLSDYRPR